MAPRGLGRLAGERPKNQIMGEDKPPGDKRNNRAGKIQENNNYGMSYTLNCSAGAT